MSGAVPAQLALRDAILALLMSHVEARIQEMPRGADSLRVAVCEASTAAMGACAFVLGLLRAEPRAEIADAVTRNLLSQAAQRHLEVRATAVRMVKPATLGGGA